MCRSAGRLASARRWRCAAAFCALLLHGIAASSAELGADSFSLLPRARQSLAEIQELWIDWLAQIRSGDLVAAEQSIEDLLARRQELGASGLPQLGVAAAAEALALAKRGELAFARAAVESAERLTSGSPEAARAAMTVAYREGNWISATASFGKMISRLAARPLQRRLLLGNLLHWSLVLAMLAALSFVGLEMATRGKFLFLDLTDFIAKSLPLPAAYGLALLLLVWPAALPAGILWLALYWSVLLWGYGGRFERVAMIVIWILLGSLPVLVGEHARRLDFALSAQVRAVEAATAGELYGTLFADLASLRDVLPESSARRHLEADIHLRLRQWESASSLYRQVRAAEPDNAAALADLGACQFAAGDLDGAVRYLEEAIATSRAPAEAYFNLSRAMSERYRFAESEAMLRQASLLNSRGVDQWITRSEESAVVMIGGGFERSPELLAELRAEWNRRALPGSVASFWRRTLSLPLALVLVGPAVGIFLLSRRRHRRISSEVKPWFAGGLERLRRAMMPGLPEAEAERWWRAVWALLWTLSLLTLAFLPRYGFPLAAGLEVGWRLGMLAPLTALVGLLVVRYLRLGDSLKRSRSGG